MTRKSKGNVSPREAGLRWLARSTKEPVTNLHHAFQNPDDPAKSEDRMSAMRALIAGVAVSMPYDLTPMARAEAFWRLITDELDRLARPEGARRRAAIEAALHLDPENSEDGIDARLVQARKLGRFGVKSNGKHHGYDSLRTWWGVGVQMLANNIDERLDYLTSEPAQWRLYLKAGDSDGGYRLPSPGAQPVFVDLFVTSVFMRKKAVHRRITERIVTAQGESVAYYVARGYSAVGAQLQRTYVAVDALWGCVAENIIPDDEDEPPVTRLWFPEPLTKGQQAHFASETIFNDSSRDRRWIDVDIDHHGIAEGMTSYDGRFPVAGLTIRVRFDETCLPSAVWWYSEVPERERYRRPPAGDPHLIELVGLDAQKTFTQMCQPRESYGIAFSW